MKGIYFISSMELFPWVFKSHWWWFGHLLTSVNVKVFIYKMGTISFLPISWSNCEQIKSYTSKDFIMHQELTCISSIIILPMEALDLTLHVEMALVLEI